jgi:hypothetical protein
MMSLTLRNDFGATEAIIDEEGGLKRFYEVADILADSLRIQFSHKHDEFDSLIWQFRYKGNLLNLHYNIYTGISLFPVQEPASHKENDAVVEVASFIESKLLVNTAKRFLA